MSVIKPFKAVRYNPEKIEDLSAVFAPPYDVITDSQRDDYMASSPYNFTHLSLSKSKSGDDSSNNQYTRSAETFKKFLEDKALIREDEPSIYFYKQDYVVRGEKYTRTGFISLLNLNAQGSKVHPHEKTHAAHVNDRLELTRALNSNLSCIFVCYSDSHRKVEKIFNAHVVNTAPIYDVEDKDKTRNIIWRLSDEKLIEEISSSVENQPLFIADGHHRFQVACTYQKEQQKKNPDADENAPFNYVMTYFTNIDSRDLKIFPMHRVVRKLPADLDFLEDYFRIDKIGNVQDLVIMLNKAGKNEHAFGLYTKDKILLLRLKNKTLIPEHIKEGSDDLKSLDANILKTFVFDKIGLPSDENIFYNKDVDEGVGMVNSGEAEAFFIMNAVKINQLKAIASNGEKMPPKTTYFYPKLLSGLTVYNMD